MRRTSVFIFIVGAALLTAGCGSQGSITGTVTYKGTPIASGNIVFAPESGAPVVSAPIKDGKYSAEKVPTGQAKVTVTSTYFAPSRSPMMNPDMRKKMAPPPSAPPEARKAFEKGSEIKQGIKIPEKYSDAGQSGLNYTVQSGKQTKDFNLE